MPKGREYKRLHAGPKSNFKKSYARGYGMVGEQVDLQVLIVDLAVAEQRKFYQQQKRAAVIEGIKKYKEELEKKLK